MSAGGAHGRRRPISAPVFCQRGEGYSGTTEVQQRVIPMRPLLRRKCEATVHESVKRSLFVDKWVREFVEDFGTHRGVDLSHHRAQIPALRAVVRVGVAPQASRQARHQIEQMLSLVEEAACGVNRTRLSEPN